MDRYTLGGAFICAVVVHLTNLVLMISHLRKNHHAIWTALGEPSFPNDSTRNSIRLTKFLWQDSKRWNDQKLRRHILLGRVLMVFGGCVLAVMFSLGLIEPRLRHEPDAQPYAPGETTSGPYYGLVAACISCFAAYMLNTLLLASYLRKNHHADWRSLGEPSLLNYSARNSVRLVRYIWSDPKAWTDQKVRRYILIGRCLYVLGIAVFAVMFLFLIASAFTGPS